jgi:tetratricopeptide (TPR) repeat protein
VTELANDEEAGGSPFEKFQSTRKQQEGVELQLERGNISLARKFTNELVDWQLKNGGPEFAAKSLCLLAQRAKHFEQYSVLLEWVQWATEIAPADAWAHGQAGDAYLGLYRWDDAKREYDAAIAYGDEPFGKTGLARLLRARGKLDDALAILEAVRHEHSSHPEIFHTWLALCETLRDMWRFEDALREYEKATKVFPNESSFWCGQAAVLKDMGRLGEALSAYSEAQVRLDPVAHGGRADVLKTMGKLDEALQTYEAGIEMFPHEPVLVCGRADVLRTMGKLQEAIAAYAEAKKRFQYEPVAFTGYADSLIESSKIAEGIAAHEEAVARFSYNVRARTGRASGLRNAGMLVEALKAFDENIRDFPYDLYSLTGRANLLRLLGHSEEAIKAYDALIERRPDYGVARYSKAAVLVILNRFDEAEALLPKGEPATSSEWVAFHIKGMMHLKAGEIDRAHTIFEHGLLRNPFYRERRYFERALAATKIRMKRFQEAAELVHGKQEEAAQLLSLHSLAELGRMAEARAAYRAVNDDAPSPVIQLRDELAARFRIVERRPQASLQWVFEQETEVLLQAA